MFVQPQHQNNSWALAQGSADSRPIGVPALYLARPASLWTSITNPGRQAPRAQIVGGRHRGWPGTNAIRARGLHL